MKWLTGVCLFVLAACQTTDPDNGARPRPDFGQVAAPAPYAGTNTAKTIRFATYNSSLYDDEEGGLIRRLQNNEDGNAKKIAAVIQHQRPDILLLNEFDFDAAGEAAGLFLKNYLAVSQDGQKPITYPYHFIAPVNTGVPSGMDLDNNGTIGGTGRDRGNDAFGYGMHPGQYGMLVLSQFPIRADQVRTFRQLRWKDLPGAIIPKNPASGQPWFQASVWEKLRLSSKSHWDIPIQTPDGVVHFLVSHPTPPVFDGADDHNGARNHDEIKLWAQYLGNRDAQWLCDDKGVCGGLPARERFVLAGDMNADPIDGDGVPGTIRQLLDHPRVLKMDAPRSEGAVVAAKTIGQGNLAHRGSDAEDTGDFGPKIGNMRLDYVLPSAGMKVRDSGVFWLKPGVPGALWMDASDHHMVWLDIEL